MITYDNIRSSLEFMNKLVEGAVNQIVRCNRVGYSYKASKMLAWSIPERGYVCYNIPNLYDNLIKDDYTETEAIRFLFYVVVHEKSHLDQDIDLNRYDDDFMYKQWIERTNDMRSVKWVVENAKYYEKFIGPIELTDEWLSKYKTIQEKGTGFIPTTPESLLAKIMNVYISKVNDTRLFRDFNVVVLTILNDQYGGPKPTRFIVKRGATMVDHNILTALTDEIRSNLNVTVKANIMTEEKLIDIQCRVNDYEDLRRKLFGPDGKAAIGSRR